MNYCYECDKETDIIIKEETIKVNIKGKNISYKGKMAYCTECNNKVYIAEIDDENIKKVNTIYLKLLKKITDPMDLLLIPELLENYNNNKIIND